MGKRFAILGHPVAHSLSPRIHQAVFEALGLEDWNYDSCDTPAEDLEDVMKALKEGDWDGFSVTIPHKKAVMPFCDELSDRAQKVGAVNTLIRQENGRIFGENTDYAGFFMALTEKNLDFSGKEVLVLGSGGAARAVIAVLVDLGAQVKVASRNPGKADALQKDFEVKVVSYQNLDPADDWFLLVNTTPLGMEGAEQRSPLEDPAWFEKGRVYAEVIYTPLITPFLAKAQELGAQVITGDRMFVGQALEQAKMFTGTDQPKERLVEIISHRMGSILA